MSTTTAQSATVRAHQHETLDGLAWRQLGSTAGHVEATLAANPGLADLGAILPRGTLVTLPEQVTAAEATTLLQLWD